jgi:hypothetical protein
MKFPYNKVLEIRRSYQAGKLSRDEAKEQLAYVLDLKETDDFCADAVAELGASHGDYWRENFASAGPLLRLTDICNILRLWARVYMATLPEDAPEYAKEERKKFQEAAMFIDIQVSKSCLLDRLFYQAETLRKEPCPAHRGRWSGCAWEDLPCGCQNGANVTGWLPNAEDTGYSDDPNAPKCDFCGNPPFKQGLWSSRVDNKHGHPACMDKNPLPRDWKSEGVERIDGR